MTRFDLGEKFPLIIIPFRPFQHLLNVDAQLHCLACVRRHLAAGWPVDFGFFSDRRRTHARPGISRRTFRRRIHIAGGRKVRLTERMAAYHRAEQRNDVEMAFIVTDADGREQRCVFAFTFRYFFRYEVEHLLARSGFHVRNYSEISID